MSKPLSILVFVLTGLFFVFFFAWPIGETLRGAFFTGEGMFTLSYVIEVFRNPIYLEGLTNAFLLAVASTMHARNEPDSSALSEVRDSTSSQTTASAG